MNRRLLFRLVTLLAVFVLTTWSVVNALFWLVEWATL